MKKYIGTILLFCFATTLFAQQADEATARFTEQLAAFPHEKIYLQTDKSNYLSGERIWFRAHLIDAASNRPAYLSRYVYVELFNPFQELVKRIKIRPDSIGVYSGYLDLEEDLPEGGFTLRAYTRYMRNRGNEFFFKKTLNVRDPYSLQIDVFPNFAVSDNKVEVDFRFVERQSGDTIAPEIVTLKLSDETTKTLSPKNQTHFNWSFSINKKRNNRHLMLGIVHKGRKFNRFYPIPYAKDDFEVSFHPEGGYLVPDQTCQVGFKAVNPSGLGEDISGTLYNAKDEELLTFNTLKFGMGFFNFIPHANESYYAICRTKNGNSKRIDLPAPQSGAQTVSARIIGSRLVIGLLEGDAAPADSLSLLIHQRGLVFYHEAVNAQSKQYILPVNGFPSGILSILLLGGNKQILSERLVFNLNKNDFAGLETESSPTSKPREAISLKFRLSDSDSITVSDNFAIAVTDEKTVVLDSTNSLVSTLLLSSELKGYVESPASYFKDDATDKHALDALMMTQGWRRYDIPAVLQGKIQTPETFQPEQFQEVSGKTEALLRSMKEGEISLIARLDSLVTTEVTAADEKGRFLFKVEYPEGTELTVQSLTKKGSRSNIINIDPVTFPDNANSNLPIRAQQLEEPSDEAYLQTANEDYTQKNGMRTIMLQDITVTAQRKEKYKESKFYSPISATGLMTAEDIEKRKASSLRSLLVTMPGLLVKADKVTTTRSDNPVLFVIDDMTYEDFFDRLDAIDVYSIDNIFVLKDNMSMLGYYPNTSGAVVITTKGGFEQKNTKSLNIDRIIPLGYQQAAAFYSPKYETEQQRKSDIPDLRTTIYWKPNVQFSSSGEALVEFYAADASTTYRIIGEGVTSSGKMIRFDKEIVVDSGE
ncbi:MAG: hypothetical protein LBS52_02490 [Dysgonamonadaceae bacterium]|jgi:hypothetical protein|nr:hypothetical protein [Dysgonamonadaceae bacterium]